MKHPRKDKSTDDLTLVRVEQACIEIEELAETLARSSHPAKDAKALQARCKAYRSEMFGTKFGNVAFQLGSVHDAANAFKKPDIDVEAWDWLRHHVAGIDCCVVLHRHHRR